MPKGLEAGSPPVSENADDATVVTDVEIGASDANSAGSSAAGETDANKEPANLLDVVKSAVAEEAPKAPEASSTPEEGKGETDPEAEAKAEAEGEAEAEVPFHNHPRWKALNSKLADREAKLAELEPAANSFRGISEFMQVNGLTKEEVATGFGVMAALKGGDPEARREVLRYLEGNAEMLRAELGESLPSDLQQKVDEGLIDEADATEMARLRANDAATRKAEQARAEREKVEQSAAQQRELANGMMTGVQKWEDGIKAKDPDYSKKAKMVEAIVTAEIAKGRRPATIEEAISLSQEAYDEVSKTFRSALPKPRATDSTTPPGSSAIATKAPASLLEAVKMAVGQ